MVLRVILSVALLASVLAAHGQQASPDPSFSTTARLPDDMRDLATEAADHLKKQEYDGAVACYQRIIDKYPGSLYAWSNLGVVRFQQSHLEEAKAAFLHAIKLSPQDSFSLSNLGVVYYQLDQYDEAIRALEKAVRLDPNNAQSHNYLGCAYSKKGLEQKAKNEFKKATEIDPNYSL